MRFPNLFPLKTLGVLVDVVMDPKDDEIPLNLMMLLSQIGAIIKTGFLKQLDFLQTTPHADSTGKKRDPFVLFQRCTFWTSSKQDVSNLVTTRCGFGFTTVTEFPRAVDTCREI